MRVVAAAAVVLLLLGAAALGVPLAADLHLNRVLARPHPVSERARELHRRLFVTDLHTDSLLWGRDLLDRSSRGHVDLPRLLEGNVALQGFSVVTKTPRGMNLESNDASTDNVTVLAVLQRWPVDTWGSLRERALYHARRLHDVARRSEGRLTVVRSGAELSAYRQRRSREPALAAGFLGVEGAQCLEGDLRNLDVLFAAGYRVVGPTHFFDNEWAGSAHGVEKGGLTAAGRDLVRELEERRMIVDLAHASTRTIDDVLLVARRPVLVSHTGLRGTCDNVRNLSDGHLQRIAAGGGLVGIGVWDVAVCGSDARAIARAVRHAVQVAGTGHVALGTDFDGAVSTPFDAGRLAELTDALLAEGLDERTIRLVMGDNAARFLEANLP